MKFASLSLAIVLLIISCKQPVNNGNKDINPSADNVITKDSFSYLPFWDSTMNHYREEGYIDTFSVNNNRFRVVLDTSSSGDDVPVEKLVNGQWKKIFELYILSMHNDYDRKQDVNNDGFTDIIYSNRQWSEAYLFNKETGSFDTSIVNLASEWTLIDTSHNIYCNTLNVKGDQGNSELYTFKGNKKIILYYLDFDREIDSNGAKYYPKMTLYKTDDLGKEHTIDVIPIPQNTDDFDYLTYWKSHYKKLLGYR